MRPARSIRRPTDWRDGDAAAHPQALRGRAALPAARPRRDPALGRLPRLPAGHDDRRTASAASPRPSSGSTIDFRAGRPDRSIRPRCAGPAPRRRSPMPISRASSRRPPRRNTARAARDLFRRRPGSMLRDAVTDDPDLLARQATLVAARRRPRSTSPPRATATPDARARYRAARRPRAGCGPASTAAS